MSLLFSDNFNSGVLTGWGSPNDLSTVNLWGDAGTYCVGCWTGQSRKVLPSVMPISGAIRAQVAAILPATEVDPLGGALSFGVADFHGGDNFYRYQLLVYLKPNGAFRIRYKGEPPVPGDIPIAYFADTAPGRFPVDGTQFGLQIRFNIGLVSTVTFTVNNVDVGTLSWTYAYAANQWDDVWVYASYGNTAGGLPMRYLTTIDNYEVDSSSAAVSWPAGTAPRLDVNRTCFLAPLPAGSPAQVTQAVAELVVPTPGAPQVTQVVAEILIPLTKAPVAASHVLAEIVLAVPPQPNDGRVTQIVCELIVLPRLIPECVAGTFPIT